MRRKKGKLEARNHRKAAAADNSSFVAFEVETKNGIFFLFVCVIPVRNTVFCVEMRSLLT